ncbi:rodlin [Yinghuangia seranimata]|uniref:rodlin n=1 Tax=Yinghuangia seranimata TaxID=408067 RepID=UPI00248C2A9D|nr:rodlin [Yinghuangia seranimata]MDI2125967.1 rodlin [Yinghuangia seranimata]
MSNLLKKISASAAVVGAVVGVAAATAPQAVAAGSNDGNNAAFMGNSNKQAIGNTSSNGNLSPNFALIQGGVANCVDIQKVEAQIPVAALIGVAVPIQDVLGNDQINQTCTQQSVQQNGDDPLSHILTHVLSENGG